MTWTGFITVYISRKLVIYSTQNLFCLIGSIDESWIKTLSIFGRVVKLGIKLVYVCSFVKKSSLVILLRLVL